MLLISCRLMLTGLLMEAKALMLVLSIWRKHLTLFGSMAGLI
ncbi:hypothetical protein M0804_015333, partial [Polistes exclamans]